MASIPSLRVDAHSIGVNLTLREGNDGSNSPANSVIDLRSHSWKDPFRHGQLPCYDAVGVIVLFKGEVNTHNVMETVSHKLCCRHLFDVVRHLSIIL